MSCNNNFWVHDINQLICSCAMIPDNDDTLEVSMNKISRLAILLSIVIMFFSIKSGVVVLIITFIFIISFYYGGKSHTSEEGFTDTVKPTIIPQPFNTVTAGRFCNDCQASAPNDPDFTSRNQLLTGFGSRKTRIQPIVANPSHDLDSWAANSLVKRHDINDKKNFDLYRSGYSSVESYSEPRKCKECMYIPCMCHTRKKFVQEPFVDHEYKDRLLTQTIQPGVYQKSNVGEPPNSMIGISYQQQFLPTQVEQTPDEIKFTQYDGVDTHNPPDFRDCTQNYSNIYDPRYTGYGDSHRAYEDAVTGQPRFFYKDIESVTKPNYVVRSNVDTFPWASTYGPDKPLQGDYTEHRQLANNAFHDSALTFRTEMQERLLRKRNAEMWQRRVSPISTNNQLGLGAHKSCL